ncbi:MAG: hypothetical protein JXA42_00245 [Anaerolineales bacterium]|nr:hypothetical protein [Anaerolineales bacterium]
MSENDNGVGFDITSNDRTWAALGWLPVTPIWPILAIVALLMEDTKDRPFVRHHAISSIVTGVVLIPLTVITLGLGGFLYFVFFYWAYQAYQGNEVVIPLVTEWMKGQGWISS